MTNYAAALAAQFHLKEQQTAKLIELIDAGNTIPFIARYRKEEHGSLDDQTIRTVYERALRRGVHGGRATGIALGKRNDFDGGWGGRRVRASRCVCPTQGSFKICTQCFINFMYKMHQHGADCRPIPAHTRPASASTPGKPCTETALCLSGAWLYWLRI